MLLVSEVRQRRDNILETMELITEKAAHRVRAQQNSPEVPSDYSLCRQRCEGVPLCEVWGQTALPQLRKTIIRWGSCRLRSLEEWRRPREGGTQRTVRELRHHVGGKSCNPHVKTPGRPQINRPPPMFREVLTRSVRLNKGLPTSCFSFWLAKKTSRSLLGKINNSLKISDLL